MNDDFYLRNNRDYRINKFDLQTSLKQINNSSFLGFYKKNKEDIKHSDNSLIQQNKYNSNYYTNEANNKYQNTNKLSVSTSITNKNSRTNMKIEEIENSVDMLNLKMNCDILQNKIAHLNSIFPVNNNSSNEKTKSSVLYNKHLDNKFAQFNLYNPLLTKEISTNDLSQSSPNNQLIINSNMNQYISNSCSKRNLHYSTINSRINETKQKIKNMLNQSRNLKIGDTIKCSDNSSNNHSYSSNNGDHRAFCNGNTTNILMKNNQNNTSLVLFREKLKKNSNLHTNANASFSITDLFTESNQQFCITSSSNKFNNFHHSQIIKNNSDTKLDDKNGLSTSNVKASWTDHKLSKNEIEILDSYLDIDINLSLIANDIVDYQERIFLNNEKEEQNNNNLIKELNSNQLTTLYEKLKNERVETKPNGTCDDSSNIENCFKNYLSKSLKDSIKKNITNSNKNICPIISPSKSNGISRDDEVYLENSNIPIKSPNINFNIENNNKIFPILNNISVSNDFDDINDAFNLKNTNLQDLLVKEDNFLPIDLEISDFSSFLEDSKNMNEKHYNSNEMLVENGDILDYDILKVQVEKENKIENGIEDQKYDSHEIEEYNYDDERDASLIINEIIKNSRTDLKDESTFNNVIDVSNKDLYNNEKQEDIFNFNKNTRFENQEDLADNEKLDNFNDDNIYYSSYNYSNDDEEKELSSNDNIVTEFQLDEAEIEPNEDYLKVCGNREKDEIFKDNQIINYKVDEKVENDNILKGEDEEYRNDIILMEKKNENNQSLDVNLKKDQTKKVDTNQINEMNNNEDQTICSNRIKNINVNENFRNNNNNICQLIEDEKKKVTFSEQALVISYEENKNIKNLFLVSEDGKIKHLNRDFNQYLKKLKNKNKPKSIFKKKNKRALALHKLNELISECNNDKDDSKLSEIKKKRDYTPQSKRINSERQPEIIEKNIKMVQEIENARRIGIKLRKIRNPTPKKPPIKIEFCEKFKSAPSKFFSSPPCENLLKSLDLSIDIPVNINEDNSTKKLNNSNKIEGERKCQSTNNSPGKQPNRDLTEKLNNLNINRLRRNRSDSIKFRNRGPHK